MPKQQDCNISEVTVVFDIGKTNKKVYLFDYQYREIYSEQITFPETKDEDGFPADDLFAIVNWIKSRFSYFLENRDYKIKSVNFSTYGATLVHLDHQGKPLTPIYNYTKPYPEKLLKKFIDKYGSQPSLESATGSPLTGFLNTGLQLYWLKYEKPDLFSKIKWSLHFPQYISYLFTGLPVSEHTSVGCHTALWDYKKEDYHDWVYAEGFDSLLPPFISAENSLNKTIAGQRLCFGFGIHDSSAALIPYLKHEKSDFLLISTGTWNITLNPFNREKLTDSDLREDCLNYMTIDGNPVRASRLFMGNEFRLQVKKIAAQFNKPEDFYKTVTFDASIYQQRMQKLRHSFQFESIPNIYEVTQTKWEEFENFENAYHQLMIELVEWQEIKIQTTSGKASPKKIYIDGGFADNSVFAQLLALRFPNTTFCCTRSSNGSALGAAMVNSTDPLPEDFLNSHFNLMEIN